MHNFIPRDILPIVEHRLQNNPAVALLGPRQVGKSTLARKICDHFSNTIYLDLEREKDLNMLSNLEEFFHVNRNNLICLDEIQRKPEIFPFIRGYLDRNNKNGQLLVLGSASRDLIRQSSETLAGRISYLEITPFVHAEVKADYRTLWLRGGLPRSYLAVDDQTSLDWRLDYVRTFLERDIPQLGFNIPANTLSRFWRMLAHVQGQTLNASKLGDSLGVSSHTVRSYIDLLEQTYVIRTLTPYEGNSKKRLIKSPKVFIRDSGLLHALLDIENYNDLLSHPVYGHSFEGLVIENILSTQPRWKGYFYRTSNRAEIDLILQKGQKIVAVEIKASSAPKLSKGFYSSLQDINVDEAFVIAQVDNSYLLENGVKVLNLEAFINTFSSYG